MDNVGKVLKIHHLWRTIPLSQKARNPWILLVFQRFFNRSRAGDGRAVFNNVFPEQYRSFICGIPHTLNPSIRLVNLMKNARELLQNPKRLPSSAKKRWRRAVKTALTSCRKAHIMQKHPPGAVTEFYTEPPRPVGVLAPYFIEALKGTPISPIYDSEISEQLSKCVSRAGSLSVIFPETINQRTVPCVQRLVSLS